MESDVESDVAHNNNGDGNTKGVKVYVKSCGTDCKNRRIFFDF